MDENKDNIKQQDENINEKQNAAETNSNENVDEDVNTAGADTNAAREDKNPAGEVKNPAREDKNTAGADVNSVGADVNSVGADADSVGAKLCEPAEKIKEWEDKYKRLLAEFDNFRKRSEKESRMMIDIGASMILTKILPIVDNFERALNSIPEDIKDNSFVDGVDKIYKQILKTFEELKVKPIDAVGKPFDANLHNAVMTDENAEGEVDTVTEELQKGYMYKDQVLRHSMVKVKK